LAVAAHEIPQEIGDFAILLHRGMKRNKVIWVNILSALTAMAGAVLTFFVGDTVKNLLPVVISLTAGFFIYIAASDLIPEIHHEKRGFAFLESLLLIAGVILIWLSTTILRV
ncbi:ZIP family metal transporter, partial [Candidatus Microgenomates bacterium]|nr:ZIP family metal transporter [Candidatus Microgenomates bacterium]